MIYLLAFLAGFVYEFGCVWWVVFIRQRQAALAGLAAGCLGLVFTLGMIEALARGAAAITFAIGYGLGSYAAVKLQKAEE